MKRSKGKTKTNFCKRCNRPFEVLLIAVRAGGGLFCSADCYQSYRKEHVSDRFGFKSKGSLNIMKCIYGLKREQYLKMLEDQGYRCKICGLPFGEKKSNTPHVDHCHTTKAVRGLLCDKCNAFIGFAREDINILKKSIEYLEDAKKPV